MKSETIVSKKKKIIIHCDHIRNKTLILCWLGRSELYQAFLKYAFIMLNAVFEDCLYLHFLVLLLYS